MGKENDKLWTVFTERKDNLKNSDLYKQIIDVIRPIKEISRIHCLGLGSIDSLLSMYQICLLSLIADHFNETNNGNTNNAINNKDNKGKIDGKDENININKIKVSLWDPIFTETDISFIVDRLNYEIIKPDDTVYNNSVIKKSTFFYLPHFPILELEKFLANIKPMYLLSNNLLVYNDKFTDLKYFQLYPNCARISKLESDNTKDSKVASNNSTLNSSIDDFQVVKKKNRKNRKVLNYIPPVVDYDFESAFFKSVITINITMGNNLTNSWSSAFTDLSFYTIISK